jgi:hypothetical protein
MLQAAQINRLECLCGFADESDREFVGGATAGVIDDG